MHMMSCEGAWKESEAEAVVEARGAANVTSYLRICILLIYFAWL